MPRSKLLKTLFVIGLVAVTCAYVVVQNLLMTTDVSTRPLDPSYLTHMNATRPKVYLISYADGHEMFYRNQLALSASALGRGVDHIVQYNRSMVDPVFRKKNAHIFKHKIGAGFWLWKPWIILNALQNSPLGSVIIYADSGYVIKQDVTPLIKELGTGHILGFEGVKEKYGRLIHGVKPEVFVAAGVSSNDIGNRPLVFANFLVIRNTPESHKFITQWVRLCEDEMLLTNTPTKLPASSKYRTHLHDQSILSVLAAKYPEVVMRKPYEDYLLTKYAVWHHRKPGVAADDPLYEQRSLIPYYGKKKEMPLIEKFFYNFYIFKIIRKYL